MIDCSKVQCSFPPVPVPDMKWSRKKVFLAACMNVSCAVVLHTTLPIAFTCLPRRQVQVQGVLIPCYHDEGFNQGWGPRDCPSAVHGLCPWSVHVQFSHGLWTWALWSRGLPKKPWPWTLWSRGLPEKPWTAQHSENHGHFGTSIDVQV